MIRRFGQYRQHRSGVRSTVPSLAFFLLLFSCFFVSFLFSPPPAFPLKECADIISHRASLYAADLMILGDEMDETDRCIIDRDRVPELIINLSVCLSDMTN